MHISGLWYRRERQRFRGENVAMFTHSSLQSAVSTRSADDPKFELLWVYTGAVYHPPRPQYTTTESLLDYIEGCLHKLSYRDPAAPVVWMGDFN